MREVKPQPVRGHQRPGLLHMRPERLAQRRVEQVSSGVIAPNRVPPLAIDNSRHDIIYMQSFAAPHHSFMRDHTARRRICIADVGDFGAIWR